jgi:hypothetical protein
VGGRCREEEEEEEKSEEKEPLRERETALEIEEFYNSVVDKFSLNFPASHAKEAKNLLPPAASSSITGKRFQPRGNLINKFLFYCFSISPPFALAFIYSSSFHSRTNSLMMSVVVKAYHLFYYFSHTHSFAYDKCELN